MSAPLRDLPAALRRAGVAPEAVARLVGASTPARGGIGPQVGREAAKRPVRASAPPLPLAFVLPLPPSALNASGASRAPRAVHAARVAYFRHCDALMSAQRVPPPPRQPWARAVIAFAAVVTRLHDADNLAARVAKGPQDWLVQAGYLADDGPDHLTWAALPTQRIRRPNEAPYVLITLTPEAP